MGFVYRLTFPSKKSYIGQTIRDIHKRLEEHQLPSSNCVAVYNAIKKYGWEKVEKEWYEIPDEDLNFYEEMLVALLGTLSPDGYNLREGGGNTGRPSEESRQKMREAQTGKTASEETKQKLREANTGEKNHMFGKTHTEDTRQKLREANLGKTASEETKQKLREANTREKNPMYGKTGTETHNSKKVYQYDLQGNFIQSFDSGGIAAKHLNKKNGIAKINECANPNYKRKSAYGFKWSREPPI
ncbi:GIY-YIG catalytic domain-containing endonuclease [Paramecium bursaria Chlorella virus OR0704.2.2]|nr:GIY-YIG catalytic domain-containing endonuclease [Paramecium bursaria Chlorella virus OR0704.2.2]